jgi:hypothetical protein
MIEAIVLNPPGRHSRVSQSELEALAGWPNKGAAKNPGRRKRMARKLSAYNLHVRKVLKAGGTMKQAAKTFKHRRNPWRDDPVGHAIAARKGWRKRGKRAKFHPKKWTSRQRRKVHARRIPRSLRRASKGFGRYTKVAANPRRRARRNILTNILTNPRHRRRVRRNILTNPRRRSYRRNPGGLGTFKATFKQLLNKDTLIEGATVTGGMLCAVALPNLVLNLGPVKSIAFLNFARQGWGSYLVSLLAAGAASGVAAYFGKQKIARSLLIGGVAGTVLRIVNDVVVPRAPIAVQAALKAPGASGMLGLGSSDVERAVEDAVNAELARQGISDYLTVSEAGDPGMGDFLTSGDLAASGLGDEGDVDPVFAEAME